MIEVKLVRGDRNGDSLEVTQDYTECGLTVPKGFRSDGISVPRFLWGLLSPCITASSVVAGVLHDYVYRVKPSGWTREAADRIFLDLLVKYGFGKFRAAFAWLGVRLFGWVAWKTDAKNKCGGCTMDCRKCYRWGGKK